MKKRGMAGLISLVLLAVLATPAFATFALAEGDSLRLVPTSLNIQIQMADLIEEAIRYDDCIAPYDDIFPASGVENADMSLQAEMNESFALGNQRDGIALISVSPNGNKLLLGLDNEYLLVYDQSTQKPKLVAPAAGIDADYAKLMVKLLNSRTFSDVQVTWSPDGQYFAITFIDEILMRMRTNANLLLVDCEQGLTWPVAPPPQDKFGGAPIRAAFHETEPILYYEVYRIAGTDSLMNGVYAYHIDTAQTELVLTYSGTGTNIDPYLWLQKNQFYFTFTEMHISDGFGIGMHSMAGDTTLITPEDKENRESPMRKLALVDVKGDSGMLLFQPAAVMALEAAASIPSASVRVFSLRDGLTEALLEDFWLIDPHAAPEAGLALIPVQTYLADLETYRQKLQDGELLPILNGALSPDGTQALLAAQKKGEPDFSLYLMDVDTLEVRQVVLPDDTYGEELLLQYQTVLNAQKRGMAWPAEQAILLYHKNLGYRPFVLDQ